MSADRQRLKSAIQRIAKEGPEIRNLLDAGKNKGGKARSAGVGTSEAEESRLCCDGSTSDNANPGASERDPDSASQDGLDADDPAKLDNGDGALSGVTDCATGKPVCFDGGGFIPPDGWDDPNQPPDTAKPGWEEGVYWRGGTGSGEEKGAYLTCAEARAAFFSEIPCGFDAYYTSTNKFSEVSCPDGITGTWTCRDESGNVTEGGAGGWVIYSCATDYVSGLCDYTEENPPSPQEWPSDGCTNLVIKNGAIVGSKYDPENDGSYSKPMDSIELCDEFGNSFELAPSASGGWKSISSQNPDDGYLYNAQGQQIARISESEYSDPTI